MSTAPQAVGLYAPYRESHVNFLYNLLFCDEPGLFRKDPSSAGNSPWTALLTDEADWPALEAIAADGNAESRVRMLACNRLRAAGRPVAPKQLFGVIVEVPLQQGLDTLAAYADGRVRYLNQSGKVAIFEGGPPNVENLARELVAVSRKLVDAIGPWDKQRLPPPRTGNARLSFLVSDGLYFGEASFQTLQRDAMGGPVLAKAGQLLQASVEAGLK
jgi:hypothetical protein